MFNLVSQVFSSDNTSMSSTDRTSVKNSDSSSDEAFRSIFSI